jgi:tagatose 6-phosphate kinase
VIICLGTTPCIQRTLLFDSVRVDEVNRTSESLRHASGKPLNVARVLHTLGEKPLACVPIGGISGEFLKRDLDKSGIAHRLIEVASETRTCSTVIDRLAGTATELVEESGPLTRTEVDRLLDALSESRADAAMLILSGSIAPGVPADFYAECCSADIAVILDARGEALRRALDRRPRIVKLNRLELADTLGVKIEDETSLRAAMREVNRMGATWVVVTSGKAGASASDGREFWKIPAIPIDAISPIGSGDAFAAGLASAVLQGREIPDACRLASAAAAANALVPGAGVLRLEDVRRLEKLATVFRA